MRKGDMKNKKKKREKILPKRKAIAFTAVLAALVLTAIIGAAMSAQRYTRTILVPIDSEGGLTIGSEVGIDDIKVQLDEFDSDDATGHILWTGSVCVTEYDTWGSEPSIYYVCPYLVANSADTITDEKQSWTLSLRFALSATQGDVLTAFNRSYDLSNITFGCKSGSSAAIIEAWTSDMENGITTVNGDSFSYSFTDRSTIDKNTEIRVDLSLATKESLGELFTGADTSEDKKNSLIVNWTFCIEESGRMINDLDGVQIEVPYTVQNNQEKGK